MSPYALKDIIITPEYDKQDILLMSLLFTYFQSRLVWYLSPALSQLKVIVWLSLCLSSTSLSPVPGLQLALLVT